MKEQFPVPDSENEVSQEQGESTHSEREAAWRQKLAEVDKIADRLGKGVDEEIKEPVAAFLAHEFTTSGSCEGHITRGNEERHGLPYPWVEIYSPEPAGWQESKEKQREWMEANLKQQRKMLGFLEEFYREREAPFDARLVFNKVGVYGGFRVQSSGAEMYPLFSPEELEQKLQLYRKEMNDFTKFLKDDYLSDSLRKKFTVHASMDVEKGEVAQGGTVVQKQELKRGFGVEGDWFTIGDHASVIRSSGEVENDWEISIIGFNDHTVTLRKPDRQGGFLYKENVPQDMFAHWQLAGRLKRSEERFRKDEPSVERSKGFLIGDVHYSADDFVKVERSNGDIENDWKIHQVDGDSVIVRKKDKEDFIRKTVPISLFSDWQKK